MSGHSKWSEIKRLKGVGRATPQPTFWYELLVIRTDPHSDVWFTTIEEALEGIRDYVAGGEKPHGFRLMWERQSGETGLVAESAELVAWAQAAA